LIKLGNFDAHCEAALPSFSKRLNFELVLPKTRDAAAESSVRRAARFVPITDVHASQFLGGLELD
jgi:hypothetical protein